MEEVFNVSINITLYRYFKCYHVISVLYKNSFILCMHNTHNDRYYYKINRSLYYFFVNDSDLSKECLYSFNRGHEKKQNKQFNPFIYDYCNTLKHPRAV